MKFMNRLRGGASALAAAAAEIVDEELEMQGYKGPEDEDDDEDEDKAEKGKDDKADAQAGADVKERPAGGAEAQQPKADDSVQPTEGELLAHEAGMQEMADRIDAVFASDEVAGREQMAAALLSAGMAADKIVAKLATLPKGAQGNDMLAALRESAGQPQTPPGSDNDTGKGAKGVWDRVGQKQGWK